MRVEFMLVGINESEPAKLGSARYQVLPLVGDFVEVGTGTDMCRYEVLKRVWAKEMVRLYVSMTDAWGPHLSLSGQLFEGCN